MKRRSLDASKQTDSTWHYSEDRRAVVAAWAHSGMQGWRPAMEDAVVTECVDAACLTFCFAVFDGHGGDFCARWAARELPRRLRHLRHQSAQAPRSCRSDGAGQQSNGGGSGRKGPPGGTPGGGGSCGGDGSGDCNGGNGADEGGGVCGGGCSGLESVGSSESQIGLLCRVLLGMDADLATEARAWGCGTTAVVALISRHHLTVANLGDSRAVLCRHADAFPLSADHKPNDDMERNRILRAGSHVIDGRINGDLALSRALGDFRHKAAPGLPPSHQPVSSVADVCAVCRDTSADRFVLIACDGVWDVMSSQEAVCEHLLDECLRRGSTDNISAVLIILDPFLRPAPPPPPHAPPARRAPSSLPYPFAPREQSWAAPGEPAHDARHASVWAALTASLIPRSPTWLLATARASCSSAVLSSPLAALRAAAPSFPTFPSGTPVPGAAASNPPASATRSALRRRLCSPACFFVLVSICTLLATLQMLSPPPPPRPLTAAPYTSVQAGAAAAAPRTQAALAAGSAADTAGGAPQPGEAADTAGGAPRPGEAADTAGGAPRPREAADTAGGAPGPGGAAADAPVAGAVSGAPAQMLRRGGRNSRAAGGEEAHAEGGHPVLQAGQGARGGRRSPGGGGTPAQGAGALDPGGGGRGRMQASVAAVKDAAVKDAAVKDAAVKDAAADEPGRNDMPPPGVKRQPPGVNGLPSMAAAGAESSVRAGAGALAGDAAEDRQGEYVDGLGGVGARHRWRSGRGGAAERMRRQNKPKHPGL